ncbi:MAG: TauD/TfdA family dioxygenase [Gammaproteobacteria bacterium]|nr:TauD/TfdA family dioxygenase [Gammaproteobacteria bacterium]
MPEFSAINTNSAFDLDNQPAYENWRDQKLENYPQTAEQLIVEINNPLQLTKAERAQIIKHCRKTNMTVYATKQGDKADKYIALRLTEQFGLRFLDKNSEADADGITSLQVSQSEGRQRYIPYSNKLIHWHTDGYYNKKDEQIHALCLHCVRPAKEGGDNALMDHEIAYIRLRDENPEYIAALMSPKAMTIPANINNGVMLRPDRAGPVFSVDSKGKLHMRYTARARHVIWHPDLATLNAVAALEKLLSSADEPYSYRLNLQSGWGLISNNVLHDRSGFVDDENAPRLLYRLRYYKGLRL